LELVADNTETGRRLKRLTCHSVVVGHMGFIVTVRVASLDGRDGDD
jgi:hypothetical protein